MKNRRTVSVDKKVSTARKGTEDERREKAVKDMLTKLNIRFNDDMVAEHVKGIEELMESGTIYFDFDEALAVWPDYAKFSEINNKRRGGKKKKKTRRKRKKKKKKTRTKK